MKYEVYLPFSVCKKNIEDKYYLAFLHFKTDEISQKLTYQSYFSLFLKNA